VMEKIGEGGVAGVETNGDGDVMLGDVKDGVKEVLVWETAVCYLCRKGEGKEGSGNGISRLDSWGKEL
jgi:hypothetical protein